MSLCLWECTGQQHLFSQGLQPFLCIKKCHLNKNCIQFIQAYYHYAGLIPFRNLLLFYPLLQNFLLIPSATLCLVQGTSIVCP